jgi:hypothetical protein
MSCIWMINESPLTDDASIFEGRFGLGAAVGPDMTNGGLVRIAVIERSKMLRTCSNARFWEVAPQHRELA